MRPGLALLWAAAAALLPALAGAAGFEDDRDIERFLREARIVKLKRLPAGKTRPWRATLSDGRITHDAHVQTVDRRLPVFRAGEYVEKDFKDCYKFNIAAYRLDRMLSLRLTPVSVLRTVDSKPAAVTWWVDGVRMDERERRRARLQPPDPAVWEAYMCNIRVFDQLIANTDRNQENLLITRDWRVWIVDHTRAFRTNRELRDPAELMGVDPRVLDALRGLEESRLRDELGELLTAEELDALLERRARILRVFDALLASGAPDVFTPLPDPR